MLLQTSGVVMVIPYVKIRARVAVEQKELIMTTCNSPGRMTLMCCDGTNDVGALKQAHMGVALLNAIPPPSPSNKPTSETKPAKPKKPKPVAESSSSSITPTARYDISYKQSFKGRS